MAGWQAGLTLQQPDQVARMVNGRFQLFRFQQMFGPAQQQDAIRPFDVKVRMRQ